MTADQLIERLWDALLACTEELECFDPDDRQTIDLADEAFKDCVAYYRQRKGK